MNRIKELRNEVNMNAIELSMKLNVSKRTISNIEKEDANISSNILINLSEIFNCSTDYILGLSDYKQIINKEKNDIDLLSNIFMNLNI